MSVYGHFTHFYNVERIFKNEWNVRKEVLHTYVNYEAMFYN